MYSPAMSYLTDIVLEKLTLMSPLWSFSTTSSTIFKSTPSYNWLFISASLFVNTIYAESWFNICDSGGSNCKFDSVVIIFPRNEVILKIFLFSYCSFPHKSSIKSKPNPHVISKDLCNSCSVGLKITWTDGYYSWIYFW